MGKAMTNLERRQAATEKTRKAFAKKPFKLGKFDCAKLTLSHLRAMGEPVKARVAPYSSPKGALRAVKSLGFDSIADLLDHHFVRVPWSRALVGDVLLLPDTLDQDGEHAVAIGSLAVAMGGGRALMYHPDAEGAVTAKVLDAVTAWRILPAAGDEAMQVEAAR